MHPIYKSIHLSLLLEVLEKNLIMATQQNPKIATDREERHYFCQR